MLVHNLTVTPQVNHYPTPNTQYTVQGLSEGSRYEFRIVALNEAGPGKPSKPSNSIVAKVQKCKYLGEEKW